MGKLWRGRYAMGCEPGEALQRSDAVQRFFAFGVMPLSFGPRDHISAFADMIAERREKRLITGTNDLTQKHREEKRRPKLPHSPAWVEGGVSPWT